MISLPEEIIELIIAFALKPRQTKRLQSDVQHPCTGPTAVLLVCKTFERIAKPLLYSSLHFRTREQSAKLAATLTAHPELVLHVSSLRVDGPSTSQAFLECAQLLANRCVCSSALSHSNPSINGEKESRHELSSDATKPAVSPPANQKPPFPKLDVAQAQRFQRCAMHRPLKSVQLQLIDDRDPKGQISGREDMDRLCTALSMYLPDTIRLEVKQRGYLSCSAIFMYYNALAMGVRRWPSLTQVDFHHRPTPLPSPGLPSPDPLALALANSPSLRLVRARRPTLLNNFLVDLARNPALRRIELLDEKDAARRYGVGANGIPEFDVPVELTGEGISGDAGFGLADVDDSDSPPPSPSSPAARILSYTLSSYQDAHQQVPLSPASQLTEAVLPQVLKLNNVDAELLERARSEIAAEPQSLFATQAIAHPRLHALTQAGRLQVVYDRLLAEKQTRLSEEKLSSASPQVTVPQDEETQSHST